MDFQKLAISKAEPDVNDDYKYKTFVLSKDDNGILQQNSIQPFLQGQYPFEGTIKILSQILAFSLGALNCYDHTEQTHTDFCNCIIDLNTNTLQALFECDMDVNSIKERFDMLCRLLTTVTAFQNPGYCNFTIYFNKLHKDRIHVTLYVMIEP